VQDKLTQQGVELFYKGPEDFAAYLATDAKRMLALIHAANMTSP
jgi:tripartite-type tricarboxylate transporter receptor subunit TctC